MSAAHFISLSPKPAALSLCLIPRASAVHSLQGVAGFDGLNVGHGASCHLAEVRSEVVHELSVSHRHTSRIEGVARMSQANLDV